MLWTMLLGLATAGPLDDPEQLKLAPETQFELKTHLTSVAGQTAHLYDQLFTDPLLLSRFLQESQRQAPGTDVVYFQVDRDRDGQPDELRMSRRLDVARLEGVTHTLQRPLLLDTDADGVTDRLAVTGGLPRAARTASR